MMTRNMMMMIALLLVFGALINVSNGFMMPVSPVRSSNNVVALDMGLFDGISKAFSNEAVSSVRTVCHACCIHRCWLSIFESLHHVTHTLIYSNQTYMHASPFECTLVCQSTRRNQSYGTTHFGKEREWGTKCSVHALWRCILCQCRSRLFDVPLWQTGREFGKLFTWNHGEGVWCSYFLSRHWFGRSRGSSQDKVWLSLDCCGQANRGVE